jgi:hypothetical protein
MTSVTEGGVRLVSRARTVREAAGRRIDREPFFVSHREEAREGVALPFPRLLDHPALEDVAPKLLETSRRVALISAAAPCEDLVGAAVNHARFLLEVVDANERQLGHASRKSTEIYLQGAGDHIGIGAKELQQTSWL